VSDDESSDGAPEARRWAGTLPWHAEVARTALADRVRWPHGLLLTGPEGIGKRRLAFEFARALICEDVRDDGGACGVCTACGYVAAGQHPDLRVVEPVDIDEDGTATPTAWITVPAIRSLIDWALVTSHRGRAKVAVIAPAERMNAAAANALLKTLEEPPSDTYLILVSHQPGRLPATVRSRCRVLRVTVPDTTAALAWLAGQGVGDAERLLAQAGGAPLVALELGDESYQLERAAWLDALSAPHKLAPVALAARIDAAPRDLRKARLAAVLDWLLGWCGDLALVKAGAAPHRNQDYGESLARISPAVAQIPLFRYHRALMRRQTEIAHPLQPRLVAETLLFDYRELFR